MDCNTSFLEPVTSVCAHIAFAHSCTTPAPVHLLWDVYTLSSSMIKAKFGGAVRSKTPVAQVNEVMTKILCYNICVLWYLDVAPIGLRLSRWGRKTHSLDSLTVVP